MNIQILLLIPNEAKVVRKTTLRKGVLGGTGL